MRGITKAYLFCLEKEENVPEISDDIDYVRKILNRGLSGCTLEEFDWQYNFVVLASYWKAQLAGALCRKYFDSDKDLSLIKHPNKRMALTLAKDNIEKWYSSLKESKDPINFLQTLPMIGETTKFHLARNIGIDCVKPDRHMNRLAAEFGYGSFKKIHDQWVADTRMCTDVQQDIGNAERLGTIDVVLWWACNQGWI